LAVDRLVTVSQVHGSSVVEYGGDTDTNAFRRTEADAMVSRSTGHGLAIRTADCVPILIGCRATGQAAAVHAGWRGVVAEVLPKTIAHLLSRGSAPRTLLAAIGPHIGGSAFEVSEDIAQKLQASAPDCRAVARHYGPKPHVVLYSLVRAQLLHAGMTMDSIDSVEGCTYSDGKSFFSFRRDGKASGRQASVIRPREPGKNGPPNNK
jgi:YfiH family protein